MFQGGECLSLEHLLKTWPPAILVKTTLRFFRRNETSVGNYSVTICGKYKRKKKYKQKVNVQVTRRSSSCIFQDVLSFSIHIAVLLPWLPTRPSTDHSRLQQIKNQVQTLKYSYNFKFSAVEEELYPSFIHSCFPLRSFANSSLDETGSLQAKFSHTCAVALSPTFFRDFNTLSFGARKWFSFSLHKMRILFGMKQE